MDRAKVIFENEIPDGVYRKAVRTKKAYIRRYGDDSHVAYPLSAAPAHHPYRCDSSICLI